MSTQSPAPLEYAPPPKPKPWPAWAVLLALFLWPMIVLNIRAMALFGPVLTVFGIVSLFHPITALRTGGKPLTTQGDAIRRVISSAAASVVGISLAVWHRRWRKRSRTT